MTKIILQLEKFLIMAEILNEPIFILIQFQNNSQILNKIFKLATVQLVIYGNEVFLTIKNWLDSAFSATGQRNPSYSYFTL